MRSISFACSSLHRIKSAARAAQSFVRRRRDVIRVRHGRRMQTGGNWAGDVRYVGKHPRADALRDLADALEVDDARIGRRAADYQFRPVLLRDSLQLVVVDLLGFA